MLNLFLSYLFKRFFYQLSVKMKLFLSARLFSIIFFSLSFLALFVLTLFQISITAFF